MLYHRIDLSAESVTKRTFTIIAVLHALSQNRPVLLNLLPNELLPNTCSPFKLLLSFFFADLHAFDLLRFYRIIRLFRVEAIVNSRNTVQLTFDTGRGLWG